MDGYKITLDVKRKRFHGSFTVNLAHAMLRASQLLGDAARAQGIGKERLDAAVAELVTYDGGRKRQAMGDACLVVAQMKYRVPESTNVGKMFMHCSLCLEEIKKGASDSPRDYARLSVAYTRQGFQVWCVRHEANVFHVDFEGFTHPANTGRRR